MNRKIMKRKCDDYMAGRISQEDVTPEEKTWMQKHIRKKIERAVFFMEIRGKIEMFFRNIFVKPFNYIRKPMHINWHSEYGETKYPFCPMCDEIAYKETHCVFCGRRFIW